MQVSVINAVCRSRDAIGEAVHETCLAIATRPNSRCKLFTFSSDFDDIDVNEVTGVTDVVQDPFFASSDVHIFHFGFYSQLFTLLGAGKKSTRRIVRFHNVTPKAFVDPDLHYLIGKSIDQFALIDFADEVWADSSFNKEDLIEYGIDPSKIKVQPLFAKDKYVYKGSKPTDGVNALYVGRFVKSKGVVDLIEAINKTRKSLPDRFKIRLVGSETFSDSTYVAVVQDLILSYKLGDIVEFIGGVSDDRLAQLYRDAHIICIPSYHEGFCVPLVEALQAGVIPIAYAAGNIPFLLSGVGEVVPVGQVQELAEAISRVSIWCNDLSKNVDLPLMLMNEMFTESRYRQAVLEKTNLFSIGAFRARTLDALGS